MPKLERVPLDEIVINPDEHIRLAIPEVSRRYAEQKVYENAPIELIEVDGKLHLAQGNNRIAAARLNQEEAIPAFIEEGTLDEVTIRSITGNSQHGVPLTSDQLEEGIVRLKKLRPKWSQQKIAEEIGSPSQEFVSKALRVHKIRSKLGRQTRLPKSILLTLSSADQKHWENLVKVAEAQRWSVLRAREVVSLVRNGDDDDETVKAVLSGQIAPPRGDHDVGSTAEEIASEAVAAADLNIITLVKSVRTNIQVVHAKIKSGGMDEIDAAEIEGIYQDLLDTEVVVEQVKERVMALQSAA